MAKYRLSHRKVDNRRVAMAVQNSKKLLQAIFLWSKLTVKVATTEELQMLREENGERI